MGRSPNSAVPLFGGSHVELLEEFNHLLQSTRADVFKEAAFWNASFREIYRLAK